MNPFTGLAQLAREKGVVANLGMGIQRQMVRIKGAVAADGVRPRRFAGGTGERPGHVPIHPVVDDQEVAPAATAAWKGTRTRVDRGADPGDAAVVGELEAVEGPGAVLEYRAAGALVAIGDDVFEGGHGERPSRCQVR